MSKKVFISHIAVKISIWNNWIIEKELSKKDLKHIKKLFEKKLMFEAWNYLSKITNKKIYDSINLDTEQFIPSINNGGNSTLEFLNDNNNIILSNDLDKNIFLIKASSHFLTNEIPSDIEGDKLIEFIEENRVDGDTRDAETILECIELLADDFKKISSQ